MPKQQTDYLLQLIISLTKAEKRFFRLFVNRNQASGDVLFLQLFDFLDKYKRYDEEMILEKFEGIKKRQISNLKAHLYKQLLLSLRLKHRNENLDIELREKIDYSRVLYNKGLFRQSLDMLDKAKTKANENGLYGISLEVIEFEKLIESQYITRSISSRADELTQSSNELGKKVARANLFSNLALQLYSLYLKVGYVRNQKEYLFVSEFFHSNLPKYELAELDFYEKLYLFQSFCWYHYMIQDFIPYYKYAQRWVNLFEENPQFIDRETPLYLKGIHNLLSALFNLWQHEKFVEVLDKLKAFNEEKKGKASVNVRSQLFLFTYLHEINRHSIEGTFSEGLKVVPEIIKVVEDESFFWDKHRVMIFYYKIACLYFGSGDNKQAIHYLNLIINENYSTIREDIQCFSRILCLIAHFELGNDLLVEYQVKSVYRFLSKMQELHKVQQEILRFIRKLPRLFEKDLKKEFIILRNNLKKLKDDPFERRPFLYLDIISWLESKIEGVTVQKVIQRKFGEQIKPLDF